MIRLDLVALESLSSLQVLCAFLYDLMLLEVLFDDVALGFEDTEELVGLFYHFLLILVDEQRPHDHLIEAMQVFEAALVDSLSFASSSRLLEVGVELLRV